MASKKTPLAGETPFSLTVSRKNSTLRGRNLEQELANNWGTFLLKAIQVKEEKRRERGQSQERHICLGNII